MTKFSAMRGGGRVALALVVSGVVSLCGLQFEQIVAKNVSLAHHLSSTKDRAEHLRERIRNQESAIARLDTPGGAIPEIHDELQLVGPHEEVIYVRGAVPASPEPDWAAP